MDETFLEWQRVSSEKLVDCKVFSVNHNRSRLPSKLEKGVRSFYVLHPHNWVNIIPVTSEKKVVMVEQFRHGIERVTLEIPGGEVDATDANTGAAASRELLEETGYVSDELILLGSNHPNPAIQSNICDTYLALNTRQESQPDFDGNGTELISIKHVPLEDIPVLIRNGIITHSLVLVAFYMLQLHEVGRELLSGSN